MPSAAAEIATVYAVFADRAEAERIGRAMVEEGFAACANILGPCSSIYRWEGKVETVTEVPALFKVAAEGTGSLVAEIAKRHSYDVPAVVGWTDTVAHAPYANWVHA